MNKRTLGYTLALAAIVGGGLGSAAVADRMREDRPMGSLEVIGPIDGPNFDFAAIDADKDGKITVTELKAFRAAKLKAADADGNGQISEDELVAFRLRDIEQAIRAHVKSELADMDVDGDSAVSVTELQATPNRALRFFERIDADGDGAVSQAEIDAAKARMAEMRKGMGPGRHGKGMRGGHGQMEPGHMMQGQMPGMGDGHEMPMPPAEGGN